MKQETEHKGKRRARPSRPEITAIIPAAGWEAVHFDLDKDGYADDDTVLTVPVACWAHLSDGEVVGMAPSIDGPLAPAEAEDTFRGYLLNANDAKIRRFVKTWDDGVDDDEQDEDESE